MTLVFSVSCFLQDEEDEAAPVGSGTLTAKVTYTGTEGGPDDLYVFVYNSLSQTAPRSGIVYQGTATDITAATEYTITINNIAPGDYYVVALYDYHLGGSNIITQTDRYEMYTASGGTNLVTNAEVVTISKDQTKELTISMDQDSWVIQNTSPISFM